MICGVMCCVLFVFFVFGIGWNFGDWCGFDVLDD